MNFRERWYYFICVEPQSISQSRAVMICYVCQSFPYFRFGDGVRLLYKVTPRPGRCRATICHRSRHLRCRNDDDTAAITAHWQTVRPWRRCKLHNFRHGRTVWSSAAIVLGFTVRPNSPDSSDAAALCWLSGTCEPPTPVALSSCGLVRTFRWVLYR